MKKSLFLITAIVIFGLKPINKTLTPQEREFAVQFMTTTRDTLLMDVKGLTSAQLNFKADTSRWSIAQCVEYIAKAEEALTLAYQQALKSPADPPKEIPSNIPISR